MTIIRTIRPDIGLIYSLLTAKCIDLSLLINYSTYHKDVIQYYYYYYYYYYYSSSVRLIEVFNNRNYPNTIYFSVRVHLIEVSAE